MNQHNEDLLYDIYNRLTQSNIKSLPFIDVSNPIWYLQRIDSENSSITSSALS